MYANSRESHSKGSALIIIRLLHVDYSVASKRSDAALTTSLNTLRNSPWYYYNVRYVYCSAAHHRNVQRIINKRADTAKRVWRFYGSYFRSVVSSRDRGTSRCSDIFWEPRRTFAKTSPKDGNVTFPGQTSSSYGTLFFLLGFYDMKKKLKYFSSNTNLIIFHVRTFSFSRQLL